MKKIIYCIALLTALLLVIAVPVSAEEYREDVAYVEKGGESVLYNGKTYLPITINGRVDDTDTTRIEVEHVLHNLNTGLRRVCNLSNSRYASFLETLSGRNARP